MNDKSPADAVREYYARFAEREWQRLSNPDDGAIEFALTCRALERHLPASGVVLDIGGGPGRYAIWLAEHGYRVVLADLSPELLAIAQARIDQAGVGSSIKAIVEADVRDLSRWTDDSFDAVLALGPFYHLPESADRNRAATEMVRVLKPGRPALVALMPRYALLRRTMVIADERQHLLEEDWLSQLCERGVFENDRPGRFNAGYGVRPEEVAQFFERFDLITLEVLGLESLSAGIQSEVGGLAEEDPAMFELVLSLLDEAASDPAILGLCNHLLYVGRKGTSSRSTDT